VISQCGCLDMFSPPRHTLGALSIRLTGETAGRTFSGTTAGRLIVGLLDRDDGEFLGTAIHRRPANGLARGKANEGRTNWRKN
jgi:hypothetical protein